MLFDGDCKLCRASVEAVRMYDNSGVVDLLDIHDEEKRALFPGLEMDALMEEIHVVDEHGRVWRGARAINEILRRQHGLPWDTRISVVSAGLSVACGSAVQAYRAAALWARRASACEEAYDGLGKLIGRGSQRQERIAQYTERAPSPGTRAARAALSLSRGCRYWGHFAQLRFISALQW